jgi:hypothetical protein
MFHVKQQGARNGESGLVTKVGHLGFRLNALWNYPGGTVNLMSGALGIGIVAASLRGLGTVPTPRVRSARPQASSSLRFCFT